RRRPSASCSTPSAAGNWKGSSIAGSGSRAGGRGERPRVSGPRERPNPRPAHAGPFAVIQSLTTVAPTSGARPMSVADTIRECHRLRSHLRDLQAEIDRGPRVLKARQAKLDAEQKAHHDHHETITKLKLKQRDDEGTLRQTEARLAKLE